MKVDMNKEEINLIQCDLKLTYIKNKDYSTYYRRRTDVTIIDNDILGNEDNLYITTNKKYNDLQEENKQLKNKVDKITELLKNIDNNFYDYDVEKLIIGRNNIVELLETLKGEQ